VTTVELHRAPDVPPPIHGEPLLPPFHPLPFLLFSLAEVRPWRPSVLRAVPGAARLARSAPGAAHGLQRTAWPGPPGVAPGQLTYAAPSLPPAPARPGAWPAPPARLARSPTRPAWLAAAARCPHGRDPLSARLGENESIIFIIFYYFILGLQKGTPMNHVNNLGCF
jgi:hypothetical protein